MPLPCLARAALPLALCLALLACGPGRFTPRLMLLAVDGATWEVIRPGIEQGRLPNFARLVREGASGPLRSITEPHPYRSAALWTSVATGKHPEQHGILDNIMDGVLPTTGMRRARPLWDILGESGIRVGVVGYYVTWPVEPVNGFMVSDRAWSPEPDTVFPPGLLGPDPAAAFWAWKPDDPSVPERLRRFADTDFDPARPLGRVPPSERLYDVLVRRRLASVHPRDESYTQLALRLLERERPDFLAVYLRGIDFVSHGFWMFHEPGYPRYRRELRGHLTPAAVARYGGVIARYYEYVDELIGRFLERAGPETFVFVLSDHGFGPRLERDSHWELSGGHRPEGVLAVLGPGVRRGAAVEGAGLLDVTPTLLHALGLPVAGDMPGRTLVQIFEQPREPERVATYERGDAPRPAAGAQPGLADEEIKESLRALGYLE
jgi:predicted AlkP superfamily phosphohydrolase/phosphomutase